WAAGGSGAGERDGLGGEAGDLGEVAGGDEVARCHPGTADGGHGTDLEVLGQVRRTYAASGDERHACEGRAERLDRRATPGGSGGEALHGGRAQLQGRLDLGRGDRAGQR